MIYLPTFSFALLHPRYWFIWLGIGLLWLIVQLPYSIIYRLGYGLGYVAYGLMRRRVDITYQNLKLCFPQKSEKEIRKMTINNFKSVGMGLIETGMAWFWSDKRVVRWMEVTGVGIEPIKMILKKNYGVLLIGIHFLTLEIGARMFGMHIPGIGVYRPNNNQLLDWLQTWGRLRSNKAMINRKNLKDIIYALRKGEVIWYAPDHDYGQRSSVFVPFFSVKETVTTAGTWILMRMSKAVIVPFVPRRKPDGRGYELIILAPEYSPPLDNAKTTALWMNRIIEKCILLAPEQYMWLHRRFKTRPDGAYFHY